ncbi:MAG TPA: ABC transporter permease [Pseudogracilibacillus sp.]|nr:ABC transporter permease [Pseudogracilibacillus sp.]
MKDILMTRLMHLKKSSLSLFFWLVFPILMTFLVVYGFQQVKEDVSIPVGVVTDQSSSETDALIEDMKSTDFIRVVETGESSVKNQLEKHKLDSAFKLSPDFTERVQEGKHHRLLESYRSNQSFAYVPVKEMVISYVQEDFDRARTAKVLEKLSAKYGENNKWTREEIMETSKEIQEEQDLLQVSLSMGGEAEDSESVESMLDIWAIWASFNVLATLLLFDWVIHERHAGVRPRFAFMRYSFKHYLLLHSILYFLLSLTLDFIALIIFDVVLQTTAPIGTMIAFQLFISLGAFLLAHLFKRPFVYYMTAFAITLVIAIASGTILPNQGFTHRFPWLMKLNPIQPFLDGGYGNLFSAVVVAIAVIWYMKRGASRVTG